MPTLSAIQQRLATLASTQSDPLMLQIIEQLKTQHFHARFEADVVTQWCRQFNLSTEQLALHCVAVAACYALPQVSHFYVGAVAIGQSGAFYLGANQEFTAVAIQQTVHAEQSAISHAWHAGEKSITDIAVNATPCGHCRQFMNELNSATTLKIHLPHSRHNLLHSYLPDAFGPQDLGMTFALFDSQPQQPPSQPENLMQAAIFAAERAYAPYSHTQSGVALQVGERIITGSYAENVAFNPSLLPLQSALNQRRLQGLSDIEISRIAMAEKTVPISHREITENLAQHALGIAQIGYQLL